MRKNITKISMSVFLHCLIFSSYGKSHPGFNFNACTPQESVPPDIMGNFMENYRQITSCYSFGVSTQDENVLLSFDCSVL